MGSIINFHIKQLLIFYLLTLRFSNNFQTTGKPVINQCALALVSTAVLAIEDKNLHKDATNFNRLYGIYLNSTRSHFISYMSISFYPRFPNTCQQKANNDNPHPHRTRQVKMELNVSCPAFCCFSLVGA